MKEALIEIKQDRPGFNSFFGSWFCQDESTLVMDVGPANSAARLIGSLEDMGAVHVDYVLLSHIHIDHCGGLGEVLARFAGAKVICHEKAVPFLVEPSKLWEGSLKVLGDVARMYGRPKPVPEENLIPHTENPLPGLTILETPGHAAHHLSFVYGGRLYAGEAAGNFIRVNGLEYLRPATPPRFFFDVFVESIHRMLELEDQPIRYAHFGQADGSHRLLERFRDQLERWRVIIQQEAAHEAPNLVERCIEAVLNKDPDLEAFHHMDPPTQKRERFFMTNSVKGYLGYLTEEGEGQGRKS